MQKIAFTIFEIAKQTFKQELPQDQILQLIEHHVKKTYLEAIAELKDKGFIDDGLMEEASKQSNIDQMMQQMQEEAETVAATMPDAPAQSMSQQVAQASEPNLPQAQPQGGVPGKLQRYQPPKLLKLVTLALVLKRVKDEKVQTILENFDDEDAGTVLRYMNVSDLENKIDPSIAMKCLKEIKASLPRTKDVSPSKIVEKLQNVSQYLERDQLEKLVQLERPFVKRLVFNALEGEYYEMPPKVANVVASFIEDSV